VRNKHSGAARRRSIRRQWLVSCLSLVIVIIATATVLLGVYMHSVLPVRQAAYVTVLAALVGLCVIAALVFVNLHFIRTITAPVKALTDMAQRISGGSYGIQADKPRDDEIGDLFDSINEMSAEIAQGEKLQTEFISSVSHELRTPLTAITGWSETLSYDSAIQGDSRRGVLIISKEASRLTKMVEELLEFTRIQGGRFNLNVEKMDVSAELEDAIFTYGSLLRQEGVELVYEAPEQPLPLIEGDPERLKQVFLNILDNAAKYGRGGEKIIVSVSRAERFVRIQVRDFGPGIPAEELPHVKEKFYKGSSKERGSGIGLAVCDEIVTRHGGTLSIENAQGGGVLVTVSLPAE
jgi:signal transduction histidine kinase